jgi:iron(III) transport system substrate-binding protein
VNRSIIKTSVASLLLSVNFYGATAAAAEPTVAEIALLQGEGRQQRLIEGAKKEGELALYNVMPSSDMAPVIDAFSKKYGIKVKAWRSGSEAVLQRIVNESRGGRFEVDVIENNAPEMEALYREKLLQKVSSPTHADIIAQAVPAHKEWVGNTIDIFMLAYNTNKVKKEELPKTYQDLLDPKWKGRLGIEAEDQHWFALLVRELGQEKGTKLFRDIVDANGISVRKGHSLLANLVASGEVPLALTVLNYAPDQLKQKGAPIESFSLSPSIAYFRGIGLARKAPHPHAAMLFYDYLQGDEAQQILAKRFKIPVSKKIGKHEEKQALKFIDPAQFLDLNAKWITAYEETVTKRVKP